MRNRQMIVRWLMANTKAIESRSRDGKSYLVMADPKAFREGVGKLLAEVQRIKSEGDFAGARSCSTLTASTSTPSCATRS
jgi:dipeptidyl-peptidase-3